MSHKIEAIEGIGEQFAAKLASVGLTTVEALLERGATPPGRAELAASTGINGGRILRWVNHADLCFVSTGLPGNSQSCWRRPGSTRSRI